MSESTVDAPPGANPILSDPAETQDGFEIPGEKSSGVAGRQKGTIKTGGRKKGTPNKVSASIKRMSLEALEIAGGTAYLVDQSDKNPVAFMGLLAKILPTQLVAEVNVHHKTLEVNMVGLDLPTITQLNPDDLTNAIEAEFELSTAEAE